MKPYACFNRQPYAQSVSMQDGYTEGGTHRIAKMVDVPFRMSNDCNYQLTDLGRADVRCHGCKHKGT